MTPNGTRLIAALVVIAPLLGCTHSAGRSSNASARAVSYFGQSPPGLTPELFAPGLVNTDEAVELNGVFSPDFTEFFFTRMTRAADGQQVFRMHRSVLRADGSWSEPEHVQVWADDATSLAVDMAYSPDGDSLYFLGDHPHERSPLTGDWDIWVSRRTPDGGWSLADPLPPPVWTEHGESYPALGPDGTLQFSSRRPGGFGASDLWRAAPDGAGGFGEPVNMGPRINTAFSEGDSCIAPDGSYIVFTSGRPGGPGNGDLYATFRDRVTGEWSEPALLGHGVNTPDTDYCPMVTPDGRFLFFSRRVSEPRESGWGGVVAGSVHWIDARAIEALRR